MYSCLYITCHVISEDLKAIEEVLLFDDSIQVQTDSRELKVTSHMQDR